MADLEKMQPWLGNKEWAAREIRCAKPVSALILVLVYVVFGGMGATMLIAETGKSSHSAGNLFPLIVIGAIVLGALLGTTYLWLRGRIYGESVCRLITLPGLIGGRFEADVECSLPGNSAEPIVIRLRNITGGGRTRSVRWQMEQQVSCALATAPGTQRAVVPVRLSVPRQPSQEPLPINPEFLNSDVRWSLEVRKKAAGINFVASFFVPIYDPGDLSPTSASK